MRFFGWIWPAAIVGGMFMALSNLLGLTTYLPGIEEAAPAGYQAVASGLILWVMILLLVGMVGLYVRRPAPGGPKVIEYGDGHARYVLAELYPEWESLEREKEEFEERMRSTPTTRRASRSPAGAFPPRRSRRRSRRPA